MTNIRDKFHSLSLSSHISPVNIVDDIASCVLGEGIVHATLLLTLNNVLYVLKFLVMLLSISQIIKNKNCIVTFFFTYCAF